MVVAGAVGFALGFAASGTETLTISVTDTLTQTRTQTQTRTIKPRPAVVTRVVTEVQHETVTEPPTSSFVDYGEWQGYVRAYGVGAFRREYGGAEVVGQIEYIGGLPEDCSPSTGTPTADDGYPEYGRLRGTAGRTCG